MKEKLSVWKIYRNAYKYLVSHLFAFAFLTIFYFIGSVLPVLVGISSGFLFDIFTTVYIFTFLYIASGCYFKQQLLFDKKVFIASGIRFFTAIALFLIALLVASFVINIVISFINISFGMDFVNLMLGSYIWLFCKYLFILFLFVTFFLVPSFAFVSEINGKNKSLLVTFAKTKGNLFRICGVVLIAFLLLLFVMFLMSYVNVVVASLLRSIILVYISLLYFKMYDFFYIFHQQHKMTKIKKLFSKKEELNVDER